MNGNLLEKPVLGLNVANKVERGLLGIAVTNQTLGMIRLTRLTSIYFILNLLMMVTTFAQVQQPVKKRRILLVIECIDMNGQAGSW